MVRNAINTNYIVQDGPKNTYSLSVFDFFENICISYADYFYFKNYKPLLRTMQLLIL
jgi:hypothetical protein